MTYIKTLSLRSSHNVTDQFSHTYKTTGKIMHVQDNIITYQTSPCHCFTFGQKSSTSVLALMSAYNDSHCSCTRLCYKMAISTPSSLLRIIYKRLADVNSARPLCRWQFLKICRRFESFQCLRLRHQVNQEDYTNLYINTTTSTRCSHRLCSQFLHPHLSHKTWSFFFPRR
jgi:hypothetical protein